MNTLVVAIGGWAASLILLWGMLGAYEKLGEERERCNSDKLQAVADAEAALRGAQIAVYERQLAEARSRADREAKARQIVTEALEAERNKPAEVREIIREVASENSCIDTAVPDAVLERLR